MHLLRLSFMLLALLQVKCVMGLFNMTTYRLMPPLYRFDNYDECLEKEHGVYCSLHIEIKSDESNPIWREIESFSSDYKRHYRHDYLNYGVCLERCAGIDGGIDSDGDMDMQTQLSRFRLKDIAEHFSKVFNSEDNRNDRLKYGNHLSACLNEEFKRKYNLSVEVLLQNCDKSPGFNEPASHETDNLQLLFYALSGSLVVFTIFSSIYDFFLKKQQPESVSAFDFYQTKHQRPLHKRLTTFSVCRNYYALTLRSKTELNRELEFLDGMKAVLTAGVVLGHVFFFILSVPIMNPEYTEEKFHGDFPAKAVGFLSTMQTFFCIAAFLLIVNFKKSESVTEETDLMESLSVWIKLVIKRYLRLMVFLAFVMLTTATLSSDLVKAPFAGCAFMAEKVLCRNNWYLSLFLANNNYNLVDTCLHQSWYLTTDIHLYIIFTLILITITRNPKLKVPVYLALIVLSSVIPACVTYFRQISGFIFSHPDSYRIKIFINSAEFYESYMPFYTNLNGHTYGFIVGEIFWQIKYTKNDELNPIIAKLKENIARNRTFYSCLLIILMGSLSIPINFGTWFMENDWSYVDVIYAGINRPFFAFISSLLILLLTQKLGWVVYDFFTLPVMKFLGRISFQTYLWHVIVLRFAYTSFHNVIHLSTTSIVFIMTGVYGIALVVGFLLTLFFEQPVQVILSDIFDLLKLNENKTNKNEKANQ